MNRRKFIHTVGAAAATLPFAGNLGAAGLFSGKRPERIVILHTNDMHSHIDPFPVNDPKFAGLGGMARRAALVRKIRSEEAHVVLLDAGDIFQGTPYFNYYGGEPEFTLMSSMGYDAATLGNHDFDNGIEGFVKQLPHAAFPFVNANYDFSDTPLHSRIGPYTVLRRGGIRIGIFGLGIELDGLVEKKLYGNTRYNDPVAAANATAKTLKNELRCDLVICLSHLGYEYKSDKISDRRLAPQTENIDLIIGGHTHTFMNNPETTLNKAGKQVVINQVGWAGINLGRIDFIYEPFSDVYHMENHMYEVSEKTIPI